VLRRPKRFAMLVCSGGGWLAVALLATGGPGAVLCLRPDPRVLRQRGHARQTASLEDTLAETQRVEAAVREQLRGVGLDGEARAVTSTAGLKFTDTDRSTATCTARCLCRSTRAPTTRARCSRWWKTCATIRGLSGPGRKSFTVLSGGPPAGKAISVKVRGDDFDQIQPPPTRSKPSWPRIPGTTDVQDDNLPGRPSCSCGWTATPCATPT
jgi:hypothetical protein